MNNLRSNLANLEALQHNTKVSLEINYIGFKHLFVLQNDLMVAQSEVEKLREELSRVRTEGTSNLFGENMMTSNIIGLIPSVLLPKGNVQKPQSRLCAVMGGVPPLAVIFFPLTFWPVACRDGGGGVPPFAVIKKSVENWPKNSVF